MSPAGERRGFPALRSAGRAFWFGLAVSLVLHAFFIVGARFPKAQFVDTPPLEARLEPKELEAAPQPEPEIASEPAPPAPPRPQPETQPNPGPAEPLAGASEPPIQPPPDEPAPPAPEPVLPLPDAEAPPPSAQPHALLSQAAQRIRNLPEHIEIVYELRGLLSGRLTHTWQQSGERYMLETVAEATGLASLFMGGRLIQKSSGRIGPLGLMPERYETRRPGGKQEGLEFDYVANVIASTRIDAKHGTRTLELPLLTGAQDPLSAIYQLALVARDDQDGLIVAASSKKVKGYPYRTLGAETLSTPLGELETLHVARAGDAEKSGTHLWLAPEQHSLPVKVSYVDEDGMEWVLEAVSIKVQQAPVQ